MAMPAPTSSQKGRLRPRPRRYAPNAITAAKPQARICRRLARRDPAVEVPSVAASQRCNATMTAARIRGFRGMPCRGIAYRFERLARIYFRWNLAGVRTNRAQKCPGRYGNLKRVRWKRIRFELWLCSTLSPFEGVAVL